MGAFYKLIPQIFTFEKNWTAKIIVAGKQATKTDRNTVSRYQNLLLMDLEGNKGNKVTAIIYDANIIALADELKLGKTYMLSNATVKDNRNEFRGSLQDKIWTIIAKTEMEELKEDNLNFLFSRYELTAFNKLERYMNSNAEISVIGIAIEVRQKRIIQTQFGTQACLQDVVLIDKSFETIILTPWDTFVENDCVTIIDNIGSKPIIWATNLKVSSYNGVTLSTKVNSTFFINLGIVAVIDYKMKTDEHVEDTNVLSSG
ncbi:Hypothetical predicted protein [Olea europaea subsp. europaea]|uniref:Replication protein A OB domain-containing protein n=1 Tax=Olea europaea subsp. europaea TaxID=158383 RepID=A0A8S0TJC8_OLEEU|nr:Hypothetical predicted protein [Olea europaea subsp. europaea]